MYRRSATAVAVALLFAASGCADAEDDATLYEDAAVTPVDTGQGAGMVTGTTGAPGPGTVGTPGTPSAPEPDTIDGVSPEATIRP